MSTREQIIRVGLACLTVGALIGAAATWHTARALERFRRDRADLAATINQARGLAAKVRGQLATLARITGYAVLIVGALVALIAGR